MKTERTLSIDCRGMTVLPGFIDAHCHVHALAESLVSLDLGPGNNVASIDGLQSILRDHALHLAAGTWIRGRGYNEF